MNNKIKEKYKFTLHLFHNGVIVGRCEETTYTKAKNYFRKNFNGIFVIKWIDENDELKMKKVFFLS